MVRAELSIDLVSLNAEKQCYKVVAESKVLGLLMVSDLCLQVQ